MNWTIGYVDDDVVYARALRKEFEARGAELSHFDDAGRFVRTLECEPEAFDMLLVDLNMADTAGVVWRHAGMEVIRKARGMLDSNGATLITILSEMDGAFLSGASKVNGADAYIQKGRRLDRLADRVIEMIEDNRARRTAQERRSAGFRLTGRRNTPRAH